MVKKKIDSRVRTLVENGVGLRHRSFFVLVGDKGRDQVGALLPCRAPLPRRDTVPRAACANPSSRPLLPRACGCGFRAFPVKVSGKRPLHAGRTG